MILVILLYAILAATYPIAKITLLYAKPFFLIAARMIISGLIMILFHYFHKKNRIKIKRSDFILFFKVALFHVYLAFIPEFWSLQYISTIKTNLIYSATPFISALLAYFILKEKLTLRKTIGMLIGLFAIIPVFLTQSGSEAQFTHIFEFSIPELVLLVAVFSASYAWFIVKKLLDKGYSLLIVNGIAMLLGGIGALFTSFYFEGISTSPIYQLKPFIFWITILIFVANIIVYNFYGWLLKKYSITFVTSAGFLSPIFGGFYGYIFLNERINWYYFISLAFIILGLHLFYMDEKKEKKSELSLPPEA